MGQLVFILGKSGTGKSYSLRNIPVDEYAVINVQGKILPFKNSFKVEKSTLDTSDEIIRKLQEYAQKYKIIVIDDFQYVMANEFMRRVSEKGFDKFNEIGKHTWDISNAIRELNEEVIVYVMCHVDIDGEGNEKIKTVGKVLDDKICLEGLSTIVLKTIVDDGRYMFATQNNGRDTVKSPFEMFDRRYIDNDLLYVDSKIREYYGMLKEELNAYIREFEQKMKDKGEEVPFDEVEEIKPKRRKL